VKEYIAFHATPDSARDRMIARFSKGMGEIKSGTPIYELLQAFSEEMFQAECSIKEFLNGVYLAHLKSIATEEMDYEKLAQHVDFVRLAAAVDFEKLCKGVMTHMEQLDEIDRVRARSRFEEALQHL
jgi:hypothetical protein